MLAAMAFRFTYPTPLRWVDIDSEGVVNNAVYLSLMEQARYGYFTMLGHMREGKVPFVLAEATVRFHKPGRIGMEVVTKARTTQLRNSSFVMEFEVYGGPVLLASGTAALVYVDAAFAPVPIPAAVRAAIAAWEGIAERA